MVPRNLAEKYLKLGIALPDGNRLYSEKHLIDFGKAYADHLSKSSADSMTGIIDELARHANELHTLAENLRKQYKR